MIPIYLSQLLTDSVVLGSDFGQARLECRVIGALKLPTGRIVACDPAVEPDLPPFAVSVAPGTWPVGVSIAHLPGDDQRITAAWIRVSDALPVRWEYAQLTGRREREAPAYGVDSATGAFVSAEGAIALAAHLDDDSLDDLVEKMEAQYVPTREWAVVPVPGTDGLDVAAFSSGLGDGSYVSYWGYDGGGEIVCLLTDFRIAGHDEPKRGKGRPWWKFW